MNFARSTLGPILVSIALLSSCGSPGAPLPPSLELAQPVGDLHASRQGETVTLTWTAPTLTTEGRSIHNQRATEICRSTQADQCGAIVGRVPAAHAKAGEPQTYVDQLPAQSSPTAGASYFYSVRVINSYGRTAGISNQVRIPAALTLSAPAVFNAAVTTDGVVLRWTPVAAPSDMDSVRFVYRIFRNETGPNSPQVVGDVPVAGTSSPTIVDHDFSWEHTYQYQLAVVTVIPGENGLEQQVLGTFTPPVTVIAHDVFPPPVPTGLQAVFSGPGQKLFIDLVWNPDTSPDLAGYNIYRHENGTTPDKLNSETVKAPALRDDTVRPGRTYYYSVSAVDIRGNESARSEEASEKVPAESAGEPSN